VSTVPPGASGTMKRTDLAGYAAASFADALAAGTEPDQHRQQSSTIDRTSTARIRIFSMM
jgi:hypothetical protein